MKLLSKRLPTSYPLLTTYREDYSQGLFNCIVELNPIESNKTKISCSVQLECRGIKQLIDNVSAKYFLRIECSRTLYIETKLSSTNEINLELNNENFYHSIDIYVGIITIKKITDFSVNALAFPFNQPTKYQFSPGTILAASEAMEAPISDTSQISAFQFRKNPKKHEDFFEISTDNDIIQILVGEKFYNKVQTLINIPNKEKTFFHSFYLLALQTALYDLIINKIDNHKWCRSVRDVLEREEIKKRIKNKTSINDIWSLKREDEQLISKLAVIAQILLNRSLLDCYDED